MISSLHYSGSLKLEKGSKLTYGETWPEFSPSFNTASQDIYAETRPPTKELSRQLTHLSIRHVWITSGSPLWRILTRVLWTILQKSIPRKTRFASRRQADTLPKSYLDSLRFCLLWYATNLMFDWVAGVSEDESRGVRLPQVPQLHRPVQGRGEHQLNICLAVHIKTSSRDATNTPNFMYIGIDTSTLSWHYFY